MQSITTIVPVDGGSFSFKNGDCVVSVDEGGAKLEEGRVFTTRRSPRFTFQSNDDISSALDYVVEKDMVSEIDYHYWDGQPWEPVAHVLDAPGGLLLKKLHCRACGFFVAPYGHSQRCSTQSSSAHELAVSMRKLAWLGDALHHADVRYIVIKSGVPVGELDTVAQRYVSAEAQAAYMSSWSLDRTSVVYEPLGQSVKQLSSAFEANYSGRFRSTYINMVHGGPPPDLARLVSHGQGG